MRKSGVTEVHQMVKKVSDGQTELRYRAGVHEQCSAVKMCTLTIASVPHMKLKNVTLTSYVRLYRIRCIPYDGWPLVLPTGTMFCLLGGLSAKLITTVECESV